MPNKINYMTKSKGVQILTEACSAEVNIVVNKCGQAEIRGTGLSPLPMKADGKWCRHLVSDHNNIMYGDHQNVLYF